MEYTQGRVIKYRLGRGDLREHIDAVHAASPGADSYTGEIAERVALRTGCACIIATVSRNIADLNRRPDETNREAVQEYRSAIREILRSCGILDQQTGLLTAPYLHLAVHGMADRRHGTYAVEIGTQHGRSCSLEVRSWFYERFSSLAKKLLPPGIRIVMDKHYYGDLSRTFHRGGDSVEY